MSGSNFDFFDIEGAALDTGDAANHGKLERTSVAGISLTELFGEASWAQNHRLLEPRHPGWRARCAEKLRLRFHTVFR